MSSSKQINPLQNLYIDIAKILELTEFKNQELANKAETAYTKEAAQMWMDARNKRDNFNTYKKWWTIAMFRAVDNTITKTQFQYYYDNPYELPFEFRTHVQQASREAYLISYEEKNPYYRMLNGLPPYGDDDYVYMSDELCMKYDDQYIDNDYKFKTPVHELPEYIQNTWMTTDDYKQKVSENLDKGYLRYLGTNKIDIVKARTAKDFDIIRYPSTNPNINPNLLKVFAELYDGYREYVMVVLYNEQLKDLYNNYRNFMGYLIIFFVLMQIGAKGLESTIDMNFLDDTVLHTIMDMYNIDDNLILTKDVRRNLVKSIPRLTREKGTSTVYCDLVDILGYTDVIIRKLMLMHGPNWDDKYVDSLGNKTYFIGIDLKDKDPYKTMTSGEAVVYPYRGEDSVAQADPRWWIDDKTVVDMIEDGKYTMLDTKYITIESTIHQMEYIFELIYFSRLVFDNKSVTEKVTFNVPGISDAPISVFDVMLLIISIGIKLENKPENGTMKNIDDLLAVAGFNFDLDKVAFDNAISKMKYIDNERISSYLKDIQIKSADDIGGMYNNIVYPLRLYLENKIASAENRIEYLEYESIYKALYTYDIRRTKWLDDFQLPLQVIANKHNLSKEEMNALIAYYAYRMDSHVIVDGDNISAMASDSQVYYITIENANLLGAEYAQCSLSIYDILTCDNVQDLTVKDGENEIPVFKSAKDGEYKIVDEIVDKVKSIINDLPDDGLYNSVYQSDQEIDGVQYRAGEYLPHNIRIPGIYKDILISKINMDMAGLSVNADTFEELLRRRTVDDKTLYRIYEDASNTDANRNGWMDKMMLILTTMENLLGVRLSYIEQMLLGKDQFFKPLVTLINHFKSIYIDIAKTDLKYMMDDKMDIGGNSNMFKLFDDMEVLVHFTNIGASRYNGEFGLYDTIRRIKHKWVINDIASFVRYTSGEGFAAIERNELFGSFRLTDEARFFLNGNDIDPTDGTYPTHSSYWHPGEPGSGRWTAEDDFLMKTREANQRIKTGYTWDMDGWKDFVESYNFDNDDDWL